MAELKIAGKIIQVLPLAQGMSKATGKEWKKQDYVLETTNDNFPKKVAFGLFNERISQYNINLGDIVTISFDVESREFNGRWYTDLRVWRVEQGDTTVAAAPAAAQAAPAAPASSTPFPPAQPQNPFGASQAVSDPFSAPASQTDDLPF
jgi:hypothetical protein